MGYSNFREQQKTANSRNKSLTQQILEINFYIIKSIKIFSLVIRIFICFILCIILIGDIKTKVYSQNEASAPIFILIIYFITILIILKNIINSNIKVGVNKLYDFIYLTLEILAVYFTILTFPNVNKANIYFNSLKGLWFVLIAIGSFSGNWYYSIYTGILTAILNLSFLYYYDSIVIDFAQNNIDFYKIVPQIQIYALSIYYILTGAFVALPFYLFKKNQTLIINSKIDNIIATPYYDLTLKDGDTITGNYLITKITTSIDSVGADYVSLKEINKGINISNLIVGDTIGHGLNRSPGAIIAMSVFHSYDGTDVLEIQKMINSTLLLINKESGGKTYCMSMALKSDGFIEYAGKIELLKIIRASNKTSKIKKEDLEINGEILGVTKELINTKKHAIYLNVGDMLLIQTDGAVFNVKEDDKTIVMITRKE